MNSLIYKKNLNEYKNDKKTLNEYLIYSIKYDNIDIFNSVLKLQPNLYYKSGWRDYIPIFWTVYYNNFEMFKSLYTYINNINITDKYNCTLLIHACCNNRLNFIYFLLNNKDIKVNHQDINGDTALLISTILDNNKIVKSLIEKGANPNIKNNKDETPLILATKYNYINLMKILYNISNTKEKEKCIYFLKFFKKNNIIKMLTK